MTAAALALVLLIESDPRPNAEIEAEIVRACAQVREPESCRFADAPPLEGEWRARVTTPSAGESRIEIRGRRTGERVVRTLRFRAEDSALERAKALGLTLGVLAKSLDEKDAEAPPREAPEDPPTLNSPPPSVPPPKTAEEPPTAETRAPSVRLSAALPVRSDPSLAAVSLGGWLGVAVQVLPEWRVGARLDLDKTLGEPASLSLLEVRGLLLLTFAPQASRFSPYVGFGASYLDATVASFPYRLGRGSFYGELGVTFEGARTGVVGWTLEPHLGFYPSPTRFSLGNEFLAETTQVLLGFALGLRVEP